MLTLRLCALIKPALRRFSVMAIYVKHVIPSDSLKTRKTYILFAGVLTKDEPYFRAFLIFRNLPPLFLCRQSDSLRLPHGVPSRIRPQEPLRKVRNSRGAERPRNAIREGYRGGLQQRYFLMNVSKNTQQYASPTFFFAFVSDEYPAY